MVLCFGSLSQRCSFASIGRAFKRRANRRNILCVSVVSFVHLQQKSNINFLYSSSLNDCFVNYGQNNCNNTVYSRGSLNNYGQNETFLPGSVFNRQKACNKHQRTRFIHSSRVLKRHLHNSHSGKNTKEMDTNKEMRENTIITIPNILSFGRILACPFLGYLVLSESHVAALLLFMTAGITDMLDGFIARKYPSQMSVLGSALDPIADKVLVGVLTVTLTMVHLIPVPLAVIILGRDIGLILSSFVVRFISLPKPKTFSRFFDLQLPTVQVTPTLIGKVNTALQLGLISLSLTAPVLHFTEHIGLVALQYVVGLTTLVSGVDYMITGRGVNILTKTKDNTHS